MGATLKLFWTSIVASSYILWVILGFSLIFRPNVNNLQGKRM